MRPENEGPNGQPNARLLVDLNLPAEDEFQNYLRRALSQ